MVTRDGPQLHQFRMVAKELEIVSSEGACARLIWMVVYDSGPTQRCSIRIYCIYNVERRSLFRPSFNSIAFLDHTALLSVSCWL